MNDEVTPTAPEPFRDVIRSDEGQFKGHEDAAAWLTFLRHLKARGLRGVRLVTCDKSWACWRRWAIASRRPPGNGAWCICIGTSSRWCRRGRSRKWQRC